MSLGPSDADTAGFEGLAQGFKCRAVELRQFIEEQNALMGKRNFARTRAGSATHEGRQRGGVVRITERSLAR
jgi:hypothetical protein